VEGIDNIQPEFQEAFAHADQLIADYLGQRLQAAYLGGSVAVGEAWPGASDFDCFIFISDTLTPNDIQWRAQIEAILAGRFSAVSAFHLNVYPLQRLETEAFWRFILRYNALRLRGDDVLAHLADRGHLTPEPTCAFARSRHAFVSQCVEAACRGESPPSLESKLDDPLLWTRKLVRNFIVIEGAFLLMVAGRFRSFRQGEVLLGLQCSFPQWSDLYVLSRAILQDPYAAGVLPEQFIRDAHPFLQWMVEVLRDSEGTAPKRSRRA